MEISHLCDSKQPPLLSMHEIDEVNTVVDAESSGIDVILNVVEGDIMSVIAIVVGSAVVGELVLNEEKVVVDRVFVVGGKETVIVVGAKVLLNSGAKVEVLVVVMAIAVLVVVVVD